MRQRREDIKLLVNHFLSLKTNGTVHVTKIALDVLEQYHWPGNIRQLNNIIDQALLNDNDNIINIDDLPKNIFLQNEKSKEISDKPILTKENLLATLNDTGYNIAKTARLLQVSRTTIYNKMKEYNLNK